MASQQSTPSWVPSAIGAGSGLLGSIVTSISNAATSKVQQRRYEEMENRMWDRNRAAYKEDRSHEENWSKEYAKYMWDNFDSPQAKLNGIRTAGLNPNLLSGGSFVSGVSGASSGSSMPTQLPSSPGSFPYSSVPDFGSSLSQGASALASGMAATSNADVEQRKGDIEIAQIKQSMEYREVELKFLEHEKQLALDEGRQRISESIQRCHELASNISLNDNKIKVGNQQVILFNKQANLAEKNAILAQYRTFLTSLESQKLEQILPLVQSEIESRILLNSAKTTFAKNQAYAEWTKAAINELEYCKQHGLLEAGYVDEQIAQMKASTFLTSQEGKYYKKRINAERVNAYGNLTLGIGNIALGAAGIYFGSKVPNSKGGGIYLPGDINTKTIFGSQSWKLR